MSLAKKKNLLLESSHFEWCNIANRLRKLFLVIFQVNSIDRREIS